MLEYRVEIKEVEGDVSLVYTFRSLKIEVGLYNFKKKYNFISPD